MPDDTERDQVKELWASLHARRQIWDEPQFLVRDVCAITGATPKALEHFLNPARNLVRLQGNWVNPGTGKRRMFTGAQVLMIQSAYVANRIGFPQRFSANLAEVIGTRATNRAAGLDDGKKDLTIITYPMKDRDDWALKIVHSETEQPPELPVAVHVINADRLIDEVHSQLLAIVAGEDIPDFSIPDPVDPPSDYGPVSNFFRSWGKDDQGRWVYVGLSHDETQEFLQLQGSALIGDELVRLDVDMPRDDRSRDRFLELSDRHEAARFKILGEAKGES